MSLPQDFYHHISDTFPKPANNDILTKTLRDYFFATRITHVGDSKKFQPQHAFPTLVCSRSIFTGKTPYIVSKSQKLKENETKVIVENCPTWIFTNQLRVEITDPMFVSDVICRGLKKYLPPNNNNNQVKNRDTEEDDDDKNKITQQHQPPSFINNYISDVTISVNVARRDKRPAEKCYEPFAELFQLLGKTLKLFVISGGAVLGPSEKFFDALNTSCLFLEKFGVQCTRSGLETAGFLSVYEKQKRTLKSINFGSTAMGVQNLSVVPTIKEFTKTIGNRLEELELSGTDANGEVLKLLVENHCCDYLRSLNLSANQTLQPDELKEFFSHCHSLVDVDISCSFADDDAISTLVKSSCNTLRCLNVQCLSAGMQNRTFLKTIAEYCKESIEAIDLFDSTEAVDDEGIIAVVKECTKLQYLNIMFGKCTDKAMDVIAEYGKSLRVLDITQQEGDGVSKEAIEKIIKNCKNLTWFTIGDTIYDIEDEEDKKQIKRLEAINPGMLLECD